MTKGSLKNKVYLNFQEKYGPWCAITGSARGIGKAFAMEIASHNINVILIDILKDELEQTEKEIAERFKVKTVSFRVDLGDEKELQLLIQELKSYQINLFCCNHAMIHLNPDGVLRAWDEGTLENMNRMINVNIKASVNLLYYMVKEMKKKHQGGIIIVGSGSGTFGTPYYAHYGATKAFLSNLGQALWWELKHYGIDVLTVLPGLTKTVNIQKILKPTALKKLKIMETSQVAKEALVSLGKKPLIVPGWGNTMLQFIALRLLPLKTVISSYGKNLPKYFKAEKIDKNS